MDIDGFMIAGFLVTMGILGDRIGRRKLLMIGAVAFAAASVPGGTIEEGETTPRAAVRECAEETGLAVVAEDQLGRRIHPVIGQWLTHIACRCLVSGDGGVGRSESDRYLGMGTWPTGGTEGCGWRSAAA
jgi:8-oxo-dGTP pyrophosphatase MutT (NUDIX family)